MILTFILYTASSYFSIQFNIQMRRILHAYAPCQNHQLLKLNGYQRNDTYPSHHHCRIHHLSTRKLVGIYVGRVLEKCVSRNFSEQIHPHYEDRVKTSSVLKHHRRLLA